MPADTERVSGDFAPRERRPTSPRTGAGPDGRAGSMALRSAVRAPPACAAGIMHSTQAHGAGITAMAEIRQSLQTHERDLGGKVIAKEMNPSQASRDHGKPLAVFGLRPKAKVYPKAYNGCYLALACLLLLGVSRVLLEGPPGRPSDKLGGRTAPICSRGCPGPKLCPNIASIKQRTSSIQKC